ncbi:Os04g0587900, partial [Oryza sativa Japonica Group]
RILAVITYHKKILKTDIDRPTACRTYLTKAEYMKAKPWWFLNAGRAWALLSDLRWCNPEWQAYSRACSERRAKMKTPAHRQGSANLHRYHKNLEKKMGTPVHVLKAYAHANRVDPDEGYCDEDSSQNMLLEAYARAFTERHGEDSNWRTEPIDGVAVHMAGGGKKHGRFFLLNGLLKTPDVLADVGRSRCSLDDPRPSRRLRPNPDDSARIEELERQLQCEREEREQERERAREEREQERERAREERERALEEMERTRKEMEQEREQARVERVREHELFQEKTSYFTCALEVLQRKLNINFLPPCTPTLTHPATSGSEVSIGNPVTTTE